MIKLLASSALRHRDKNVIIVAHVKSLERYPCENSMPSHVFQKAVYVAGYAESELLEVRPFIKKNHTGDPFQLIAKIPTPIHTRLADLAKALRSNQ